MKNYRIYICFAVVLVLMALLYPKDGKFKYEYTKGRPWAYETLIARFDFPLLKTEAEILKEKEARSAEIVDYFGYDKNVAAPNVSALLQKARGAGLSQAASRNLASQLSDLYGTGIVSQFSDSGTDDKVIFIKHGKRYVQTPAANVLSLESATARMEAYMADLKLSREEVEAIDVKEFIVPNLIFDANTTQIAHKEAVDYISPTKGIIYAGQLIVSEGETVTSDICQMLDSYKTEYKMSFGYAGSEWALWLSHFLLAIVLAATLFFTILFLDRDLFSDLRSIIFLTLLSFMSYLGVVIAYSIGQSAFYLVPFTVLVLYINAFFRKSIVWPLYMVILLPLILIPEGGVQFYLIYLTSGFIILFAYKYFSRGWLQFANAVFVFAAMMFVYTACSLASGAEEIVFSKMDIILMACNAVLTVVLYPFVFIFEKAFAFVSYTKLLELADTNNKLLQELQVKAPGTFQHSLQVANLAENAARRISAYFMLAKVGALYHDIGKMENPACFVENRSEGTTDYHKFLSPEESAHDIIKHVEDGMELAGKFKLPSIISDFILTHHGTTMTGYFYTKFCNEGGDETQTAPFTYKGRRPESKEEVIVMLADAVEAAARTLPNYTEKSISELVEKIVEGKIGERQIEDSSISLKDLGVIKMSFKEYLMQIYHSRIVYPKRRISKA